MCVLRWACGRVAGALVLRLSVLWGLARARAGAGGGAYGGRAWLGCAGIAVRVGAAGSVGGR